MVKYELLLGKKATSELKTAFGNIDCSVIMNENLAQSPILSDNTKLKVMELKAFLDDFIQIRKENNKVAEGPEKCAQYIDHIKHYKEEHFFALYLNCKNVIISDDLIGIGNINEALINKRSLFRKAIAYNAAAIILVHNHPSGDPEPSLADIRETKNLIEAGKIMEIPVLDHVVIAKQGYVSLRERGLL